MEWSTAQRSPRPTFLPVSRGKPDTGPTKVLQIGPVVDTAVMPGSRLLETSCRIGVWPDSVQVPGGTLSLLLTS